MPVEPIRSSPFVNPVWYTPEAKKFSHAKELYRPDTISSIEDEDERLKKVIPLLTTVPQILTPQELSQKTSSDKKLDELGPLKRLALQESDSLIEKDVMQGLYQQRTSQYDATAQTFKEVKFKQDYRKALHTSLDDLEKKLIARKEKSETLKWVQTGVTVGMVLLTVLSFALSFVTAGGSLIAGALGIVGSLSAVAGAVNGAVGATNGFQQLETQQKQGEAIELKELRSLEHGKVDALLSGNQITMQRIHELWSLSIQIIRNQSNVRFFGG